MPQEENDLESRAYNIGSSLGHIYQHLAKEEESNNVSVNYDKDFLKHHISQVLNSSGWSTDKTIDYDDGLGPIISKSTFNYLKKIHKAIENNKDEQLAVLIERYASTELITNLYEDHKSSDYPLTFLQSLKHLYQYQQKDEKNQPFDIEHYQHAVQRACEGFSEQFEFRDYLSFRERLLLRYSNDFFPGKINELHKIDLSDKKLKQEKTLSGIIPHPDDDLKRSAHNLLYSVSQPNTLKFNRFYREKDDYVNQQAYSLIINDVLDCAKKNKVSGRLKLLQALEQWRQDPNKDDNLDYDGFISNYLPKGQDLPAHEEQKSVFKAYRICLGRTNYSKIVWRWEATLNKTTNTSNLPKQDNGPQSQFNSGENAEQPSRTPNKSWQQNMAYYHVGKILYQFLNEGPQLDRDLSYSEDDQLYFPSRDSLQKLNESIDKLINQTIIKNSPGKTDAQTQGILKDQSGKLETELRVVTSQGFLRALEQFKKEIDELSGPHGVTEESVSHWVDGKDDDDIEKKCKKINKKWQHLFNQFAKDNDANPLQFMQSLKDAYRKPKNDNKFSRDTVTSIALQAFLAEHNDAKGQPEILSAQESLLSNHYYTCKPQQIGRSIKPVQLKYRQLQDPDTLEKILPDLSKPEQINWDELAQTLMTSVAQKNTLNTRPPYNNYNDKQRKKYEQEQVYGDIINEVLLSARQKKPTEILHALHELHNSLDNVQPNSNWSNASSTIKEDIGVNQLSKEQLKQYQEAAEIYQAYLQGLRANSKQKSEEDIQSRVQTMCMLKQSLNDASEKYEAPRRPSSPRPNHPPSHTASNERSQAHHFSYTNNYVSTQQPLNLDSIREFARSHLPKNDASEQQPIGYYPKNNDSQQPVYLNRVEEVVDDYQLEAGNDLARQRQRSQSSVNHSGSEKPDKVIYTISNQPAHKASTQESDDDKASIYEETITQHLPNERRDSDLFEMHNNSEASICASLTLIRQGYSHQAYQANEAGEYEVDISQIDNKLPSVNIPKLSQFRQKLLSYPDADPNVNFDLNLTWQQYAYVQASSMGMSPTGIDEQQLNANIKQVASQLKQNAPADINSHEYASDINHESEKKLGFG